MILVDTALGPTGGYRLRVPSSELTFLDIVEAVEGKSRSFVCNNIRANNPCRPQGYCDRKPCAIARIMWTPRGLARQPPRPLTGSPGTCAKATTCGARADGAPPPLGPAPKPGTTAA